VFIFASSFRDVHRIVNEDICEYTGPVRRNGALAALVREHKRLARVAAGGRGAVLDSPG